jgi:opacity protein-like surface antigen
MRTSRWLITSAAAAIALLPQAALAQDAKDETGFYVGLDLGITNVDDADITYYDAPGTFDGTGARDTAEASIDTGSVVGFGGVIGYDFGTIRADVEIDYSRNDINSLTFIGVNGSPVTFDANDRDDVCDYLEVDTCGGSGNTFEFDGSRVRQLSAMGNLWIDLPIGSGITPYAGGGLGIAGFEFDGEGTGKFAWQLGAGVAAKLSSTISLSLDFRHRQIGRTTIEFDESSGFELGRLKTNTISAGVRFTF